MEEEEETWQGKGGGDANNHNHSSKGRKKRSGGSGLLVNATATKGATIQLSTSSPTTSLHMNPIYANSIESSTPETSKKKKKNIRRKERLRRGWGSLRTSRSEEGLSKRSQVLSRKAAATMFTSSGSSSGSGGATTLANATSPTTSPRDSDNELNDEGKGPNYSRDGAPRDRGRPRSLSSGSEPAGYPGSSVLLPLKGRKDKDKKPGKAKGERKLKWSRDKDKDKGNGFTKPPPVERQLSAQEIGGSRMGGWIGGEGGGRLATNAANVKRSQSDLSPSSRRNGEESGGASNAVGLSSSHDGSDGELLSVREYFSRFRSGTYEVQPKKSTTTRYIDLSCLRVFEELSSGKGTMPSGAEERNGEWSGASGGEGEVSEGGALGRTSSGERKRAKEREAEEVCLAQLNNLPEELLVAILSHLSAKELLATVKLVNKRFCRLAEYKGFWRSLMRRDFQQDYLICQTILSKAKRNNEAFTTSKEILYKNGFATWKGFYETAFNFYGSTKVWRNSNHMYGQYMREYYDEASGNVNEAKALSALFEKFTAEELRDICMDSKIVCVGNTDVGKGYFCLTYQNRKPSTDYHASHFNNYNENIMIHGNEVRLSLWNTSGHEHYPRLRTLNYPKSTCFMLLYSVVNEASFRSVAETWTHELRLHCPGVPLLLVATKSDLRRNENLFQSAGDNSDPDPAKKYIPPCISYRKGIEMAKKLKAAAFVEVSAINNLNIQEAVREAVYLSIFYMAQEIRSKKKSKETSCLLQ